jgi:hypothetical protein
MDKELQQYYEDRFTMFTTTGWKDLIVDIEKIKDTIKVEDIPDEKTLFARRGELRIMNWLLSLKDVSEQAYKDLHDEDIV